MDIQQEIIITMAIVRRVSQEIAGRCRLHIVIVFLTVATGTAHSHITSYPWLSTRCFTRYPCDGGTRPDLRLCRQIWAPRRTQCRRQGGGGGKRVGRNEWIHVALFACLSHLNICPFIWFPLSACVFFSTELFPKKKKKKKPAQGTSNTYCPLRTCCAFYTFPVHIIKWLSTAWLCELEVLMSTNPVWREALIWRVL